MGARKRPQGERPRPYFRRGAGRIRQGALTLEIRLAGDEEKDLPWSWEGILDDQRQGGDPLAGWRHSLAESTARQYASAVPASMPCAFVLQWVLEVAAEVGVHAAWHHPWVVDPAQAGLSFTLHQAQLYPVAARLRRPTVTTGLLDERLEGAHAAYLEAGTELALGYRCEVRLGEHTRIAMVDDVWSMALARARGQRPPRRESCCFIYVLPGVHECSGCPRLPVAPDVAGSGTAGEGDGTGSARPAR